MVDRRRSETSVRSSSPSRHPWRQVNRPTPPSTSSSLGVATRKAPVLQNHPSFFPRALTDTSFGTCTATGPSGFSDTQPKHQNWSQRTDNTLRTWGIRGPRRPTRLTCLLPDPEPGSPARGTPRLPWPNHPVPTLRRLPKVCKEGPRVGVTPSFRQ